MKRRVLAVRVAMVIVATLVVVGALLVGMRLKSDSYTATKEDTVADRAFSTLAPNPAFAKAGGEVALADIAERVVPSVVNISSEKVVQERGGPPALGPFFNDPFFRRFFEGPMGPSEQPRERRESSLGSGVIISEDGTVLTNNHVIEDADTILVALADGREFDAEVVGRDPESDLGVLKLKGEVEGLTPLEMGDSSAMRLGDVVLAIGNPFGVGQTVTMGIVSATGRASLGIVQYEDFIQTDAAINPGNSGGALVNMRGELIGVNTAIISRTGGYQGIGFAIPSDMARPIMKSLLEDGKVERGWLGVAIQDITPELQRALDLSGTEGVLISDVNEGSPAAQAGLQRGDIVLTLNGAEMDSTAKLRNAVAASGPRTEVTLEILRNKEQKTLRVKLGEKELPTKAGQAQASDERLGGLTLAEPTTDLRRRFEIPESARGVVVTNVESGSAAARAGFRAGDVIVEVNRTAIATVREFRSVYDRASGVMAVLVQRQGNTLYLVLRK